MMIRRFAFPLVVASAVLTFGSSCLRSQEAGTIAQDSNCSCFLTTPWIQVSVRN
jgi:hypothetical protein